MHKSRIESDMFSFISMLRIPFVRDIERDYSDCLYLIFISFSKALLVLMISLSGENTI
jgi:hypothetical protein